ncbi:unnamed protein product, partial [Cyprideis torosa]
MALDLNATGLLDAGIYNSLGVPDEKIVAEGAPERSILYLRANSLVDGVAMPPIAKNKIDEAGVALIREWIGNLNPGTGDENLALNRPVMQVSTDFGGTPEKAVDGNRSGIYNIGSVTHTTVTNNPWWRVDLGKQYDISKIHVYNRTDCCSDRLQGAKLYVGNTPSSNPADYTEVGTLSADSPQFISNIDAQ